MSRHLRVALLLGVFGVMAFFGPTSAEAALDGVQERKDEIGEAQDRLREIRTQASVSYETYNSALVGLNDLDKKIEGSKKDLANAEDRVTEAQKNLEDAAAQVYKSGNVRFIDVLVGSKDFSEFASRLNLWIRLLGEERDRFEEVRDARNELKADQAKLQEQRDKRVATLEMAIEEKDQAESAASEAENYLQSLNSDLRDEIQAVDAQRALEAQAAAQAAVENAKPAPASEMVQVAQVAPKASRADLRAERRAAEQRAAERADKRAAADAAAKEAERQAELAAKKAAEEKAAKQSAKQVAAQKHAEEAAQKRAEERRAEAKAARQAAEEAAIEQAAAERAAEQAAQREAAKKAAEEQAAAEKAAEEKAAADQAAADRLATRQTAREQAAADQAAAEKAAEETAVPEVTTPEENASEVSAPEATAPEATAPETTAPEATTSETTVPETTVPETTVPETTSPEPAPAPSAGGSCGDTFGGVQPNVAEVGCAVRAQFGLQTIYGYRAGDAGDHGTGRALDFMVYSDAALGDQVAEYLLANQGDFGINYIIWQQRINFGSGWQPMEDRGSITANHYDHVHASFY